MISIRVEGQEQLERKLTELTNVFTSPRDLLDEAAAILLNSIRFRYLHTMATDGTIWPRSRAAIRREKSGRGGDTLFDTGNLFRSIQEFAVGDDSRAIGTDVSYGIKHQYGLEGLPKREFLGVASQDLITVNAMIMRRVQEALVNG